MNTYSSQVIISLFSFPTIRSPMNKLLCSVTLSIVGFVSTPQAAESSNTKNNTNFIFIIVDDLRPQLNCYGSTQMKTPHIDRLAKNGVLFNQAYCQASSYGPSRTSFLSGLRPTTSRCFYNNDDYRKKLRDRPIVQDRTSGIKQTAS